MAVEEVNPKSLIYFRRGVSERFFSLPILARFVCGFEQIFPIFDFGGDFNTF